MMNLVKSEREIMGKPRVEVSPCFNRFSLWVVNRLMIQVETTTKKRKTDRVASPTSWGVILLMFIELLLFVVIVVIVKCLDLVHRAVALYSKPVL